MRTIAFALCISAALAAPAMAAPKVISPDVVGQFSFELTEKGWATDTAVEIAVHPNIFQQTSLKNDAQYASGSIAIMRRADPARVADAQRARVVDQGFTCSEAKTVERGDVRLVVGSFDCEKMTDDGQSMWMVRLLHLPEFPSGLVIMHVVYHPDHLATAARFLTEAARTVEITPQKPPSKKKKKS